MTLGCTQRGEQGMTLGRAQRGVKGIDSRPRSEVCKE